MPSIHIPTGTSDEISPKIIDIRHYGQQISKPQQNGINGTAVTKNAMAENVAISPPVKSHLSDESIPSLSSSGSKIIKEILAGLCPEPGQPKKIPTVVLYDDKGLQIYDEITYLEEYYLVQEEIDILKDDSDRIVDLIPDGSVVVELGSGSLRKTRVLLDALEKKRRNINYYALDLMRDELTKSLVNLVGYKNVTTAGLWGTYDEGMAFISSFSPDTPKTILWLGSSIGNMTRNEAKDFISSYRDTLNVGDNWLIGIDRRNSPKDITLAYNDPKSVTREFILNGLDHVNRLLGQPLLNRSKFEYFGQYNSELGRHEAYFKALESQALTYKTSNGENFHIQIVKDELINVEYSYKWSLQESKRLFEDARMPKIGQWTSPTKRYDLHMLRKVPFYFQTRENCQSPEAPAMPSTFAWEELWKSWNIITQDMIHHPDMLEEQPIDLRHPFLFYLGHIPSFLDIQLSRIDNGILTEPTYFVDIFARGIDPDVDDPTQCHPHSIVPDNWPKVEDILEYRDKVLERLYRILGDSVTYPRTRRFCRLLFIAFEHQAMHAETILYMLAQSNNTVAPPSIRYPGLKQDSYNATPIEPATWIEIHPNHLNSHILSLGHNDLESNDFKSSTDISTEIGWDNEHPLTNKGNHELPQPFLIQSRQVTNGEYYEYWNSQYHDTVELPRSWALDNGSSEIFVKTVFGKVPLEVAKNWPAAVSQKEAIGYATWLDPVNNTVSLPTEHQLSIAFKLKETSPYGFLNCNYGFKSWYPQPSLSERPVDHSEWSSFQGPGALWDWTSTSFQSLHPDFEMSQVYPGYSTDFFDGKHWVVLGASWATHPYIAERRSFRNWYQGNYSFAFIGFRLVKNVHPHSSK